ncbi:MAG: Na+/H+ antiporter subunit D, partial [Acidimicrobiia bacterium]|nr:Na+/H+ antiporter subunit D [Acidimicrobiia bacterium]
MKTLATLPVIIPIAAAALALVSIRRPLVRRIVGLASSAAYLAIAVWLVIAVDGSGTIVAAQGDWPAPLGIPLVADRLAVLLLATSAAALLAVLVYA